MQHADDARFLRYFTAVSFFGLLLGLSVSQCGCGPSAHQKALRGSLAAVDAAAAGFVAYDHEHKRTLLAEAPATPEGRAQFEAKLLAYHERRAKVLEAFRLAYATIATGALEPKKVTIPELVALAAEIKRAVDNLRREP